MMAPKEIIAAALDLFYEMEADPRNPVLQRLEKLIQNGPEIPDETELRLVATIEQGGVYRVTDQYGRTIKGVQSVAVFKDPQTGRDIMQVNL